MTLEEALRDNERLKGQVATLEQDNKSLTAKNAEFSEQAKAADAKAAKAEKDLADQKAADAKSRETRVSKEISEFVESLVAEGRVKPADKDTKIAQLTAAAKVQQYEFAEDGGDTFGALKAAWKELPVQDELKDFAEKHPKGGDGNQPQIDSSKIMSKI